MAKNLTTGLQRGLRQSIAGGLGTGDLFSIASLDLQFARHKSLDSRVTHTRQSSATYVDGDGVIRTAVTNLLLRSEEFDQSPWVATAFSGGTAPTVTANAATAPDGTVTADQVSFSAETGSQQGSLQQNISVTSGVQHTLSFWARTVSGTVSNLLLRIGTIEEVIGQPITTEWKRYSTTVTVTSSGAVAFKNRPSATGDGTAIDIYLWGAQLEESSTVGQYVKTTTAINSAPRFDHDPETGESLGLLVEESRTNLLTYSEEFNNSAWYKGRLNVSADLISAPDGTLTADKLVATTDTNISHLMDSPVISTAAGDHTFSAYFKAGEYDYVIVDLRDSVSIKASAVLDLRDGTTSDEAGTISVVPLPDGWYRLVLSATLAATSSFRTVRIYVSDDGTTDGYTGDNVSGIYAWGAQLEVGSFPTSYIPTEGSQVTRAADVTSITGTNFSSWYEQSEGTVFSDSLVKYHPGTTQFVYQLGGGSFLHSLRQPQGNANSFRAVIGNTFSSAPGTGGVAVNGSVTKAAIAYTATNGRFQVGTSGTDVTPAGIADSNQITLGNNNGTINRLTYWPTRLSNDTLQTITR